MNNQMHGSIDLTKYTLVENKNWKEVLINEEPLEIPEEWAVKPLKECINIEHGTRVLKKDSSGDYPVYGGGESGFNWKTWNKENKWVIARFALSEKCVRFVPGKFWLMDSGFTFSAINDNSEYFLGYVFNSLQPFFYSTLARGAAQKNMDMTMFLKTNVTIPPLSEQTSIASVLSTQETIISDISLLISKHEMRLAWLSDQLLSGKLRVKRNMEVEVRESDCVEEFLSLDQLSFYQNPDDNWKEVDLNGETVQIPVDWNVKQLNNCIKIEHGTRVLKKDASGEYPVYGGGDTGFNWKTWNKENKWVIARFALSERCVRFVSEKFWLMDSGFTFSPIHDNDEQFFGYLFKSLQSFFYSTLARGAAQKNMDMNMFLKTDISAPPLLEQRYISLILSAQEQLISDYKKLLEKEKERMSWLSDALLSGKYRLKPIEV